VENIEFSDGKAGEILQMIDLPRTTAHPIVLALAGQAPTALLSSHGWNTVEAMAQGAIAFLEAMDQLGFKRCDDFNGPHPEGYGPRQGTIRDGRRDSTAVAYLRPARSRGNLAVLVGSLASRVVIENGKATGVEVQRDGDARRIQARREVVVCAGAVQSPQLLMLSGIGDGAALRALGIDVKHSLPGVGANYHDHLAAGIVMEMTNSESYGISLRAAPRGAWNLIEYALFRSGPLASNVFEANAFVRSKPELDRADLQIVFQPARRNPGTFPFPLGHGFALSVVHLYPKSRGRVSLASPDPRAAPVVDPNLLGVASDLPPTLHGLEPIPGIGQCPGVDHRIGVFQEAGLHL
jgi:choline dehydrogenase-like flavoprotein